jgi:hypothetical protein
MQFHVHYITHEFNANKGVCLCVMYIMVHSAVHSADSITHSWADSQLMKHVVGISSKGKAGQLDLCHL